MNNIKQNEFIFTKLEASIKKENAHVNEIKIVSPFINGKGIKFMQELIDEAKHLKSLKIITTTFDGKSKFLDLDGLVKFKNKNQIVDVIIENSYLANVDRLHSKNIIFVKTKDHNSVAFVGSSNMTDKGLSTGKESSVRIDQDFNPQIFQKINDYFDELWQNKTDFFNISDQMQLNLALSKKERYENCFVTPSLEELKETDFYSQITKNEPMQLFDYQKTAIQNIFTNIENGYKKHLIVMATGTGKTFTIMSFIQQYYENADIHKSNDLPRVLYLAPRNEILEQAIATLKKANSNVLDDEIFKFFSSHNKISDYQEEPFIFTSYNSAILYHQWLTNQHFDLVIIDEVHHSEATGLKDFISKMETNAKHLIGLTATPERTDGVNIADYFDGGILFEMSLPSAIELGHLSNFDYYFVDDYTTSLEGLDITKDLNELAKRLDNNIRHDLLLKTIQEKIIPYEDDDVKAVLFCVNKQHAKNTANFLISENLKADVLTSDNQLAERKNLLDNFKTGKINFLCVVDIFNEGIDIPEINNLIFLRPTASFLIYLQQFGRGLRKQENKILSIYDFVNNVDLKVNKQYHPFWLAKAFFDTEFRSVNKIITCIKDDELNLQEKWIPGNSMIHMTQMNRQTLIKKLEEYAKTNAFGSIFKDYHNQINNYKDYEEFFLNTQMMPHELYQKNNQKNLISNENHLDFGAEDKLVLMNLSTLNHKKLIEEFLKIIEQKVEIDPFFKEMFISYFYTNRTTINKYRPTLDQALATILSKKELLRETEYLLKFKLNNEVLMDNEINNFQNMILTQLQIQAIMGYYSENNMIEARTIMSGVQELSGKILLNARENVTDVGESGIKQFFDKNQNILHWYSPDGWSLEKRNNKNLISILDNTMPVYVLYKTDKLLKKFGNNKYGIFLGVVASVEDKKQHTNKDFTQIEFKFKMRPL
ncbi:DEAD/DEAH box helicase family protein [Williamsoniiplasma lucivorax]|uniref:DEAD/DEAH family helicase n=1 Tax=Williamsoniiplasma lucivorax TaxID=209274 RepID=A0A2S5RE18_9MOLU|nr:DEAD/DEAH box helicase family protein [Williamsoniiplasma lucivorax]PPE05538.1 DEAD/DEAH family helicase [Williamsoniiplasma lucivorax]